MPESIEGLYVNRETKTICRVNRVDDAYAYIEVIYPNYSRWAMPIADYDSRFFESWRPATAEDMAGGAEAGFRPPRNQTSVVDIAD